MTPGIIMMSEEPAPADGDRLDRVTFHRRYEATAEQVRAELLGGVAYFKPRRVGTRHGSDHGRVHGWLGYDHIDTPGVTAYG